MRRTVVEHVIETDASGTQRIGARRVARVGDPPESDPVDESPRDARGRARLSGR